MKTMVFSLTNYDATIKVINLEIFIRAICYLRNIYKCCFLGKFRVRVKSRKS